MGKVEKMNKINKAKVVLAVSSIIFIQNIVFAASAVSTTSNDLDSTYKDGANTAKSYIQQPIDNIKNLHPEDKFKGYYTDNPPQGKYFKGVTQGDTQDLAKDAVQEVKSNEAGKATLDSAESHPKYFVSPDSYEMQKANSIISHAANISTGQGIDCNQSKICHTDYVKQQCNEDVRYLTRACTKIPKITIVDQPYTEARHYSGSITSRDNYSGTFLLPVSGTITNVSVQAKSDNVWRCHNNYSGYLQGTYLSSQSSGCGEGLGDMGYNNEQLKIFVTGNNPIVFSFNGGPSYGRWDWARYNLTIQADLSRKVAQVDWSEDCDGSASGEICTDKNVVCTEAGGTRYFDGIPVTLDCWHYNITKQCGAFSDNDCKALRDQGCAQIDAKCRTMLSNICVVQDETYSCPVQKCDSYGIVCNDGSSYCLTGNCFSHDKTPDKDMGKSLSALSAAADASHQFDSKALQIFTGNAEKCSHDSWGAYDCCSDSGWVEDLFPNCSEEEKKLGHNKEVKLVVDIGEYTVDHVLWKEHIHSYCAFGSKLARIVRQAGKAQRGFGFGSAEHPNCRGLTPEELQQIDFSKIDFKEVEQEIIDKMDKKDQRLVNQKIQQDIDQLYRKKQPHV